MKIPTDGRRRDPGDESGFTLIEMVMALGIMAVAFTALASLLFASLRTVAVQKARSQGNEIATQGIEDLQRLSYNALGLCAAPPGPVAPGLADTVLLPNCAGPPVKYQPCGGTPTVGAVPDEVYDCSRLKITYNVRRFVAYGDIAHTQKRLAVFVRWTDTVGVHEVSQQSSLRIPSRSAVVGLPPPTISAAATNVTPGSIALNADGTNNPTINFSATTSGLTAVDTVLVSFTSLTGGQPEQGTVTLASGNGTNWLGSLPAGSTTFGNGAQFFTFTAIRKDDGKVNSLVYPSATPPAAPAAPVPIGSAGTATIAVSSFPSTVDIDGSGGLVDPPGSFGVAVDTVNVSPQDSVILVFGTQTGAVSLSLDPDPFNGGLGPCIVGQCTTTWRGTVDQGAGYPFLSGPQYLYFFAVQGVGPNPVDVGATAAVAAGPVNFS